MKVRSCVNSPFTATESNKKEANISRIQNARRCSQTIKVFTGIESIHSNRYNIFIHVLTQTYSAGD